MPTSLLTLPVDDATRRQFITLLGAAGLLTACGGPPTADPSGAEAVTVAHAGGETTFDGIPSRIVILDDAMLGDLLAFDVVPVGTAGDATDPTVSEVWRAEAGVEEIPVVAPDSTPNLEAIAAIRPDAIFAVAFQVDEPYWSDLQAIAPTIAVESSFNTADLTGRFDEIAMRTYAQVLRRPEIVDEVAADYQRRVTRVRTEFIDVIDGATISFTGSRGDGTYRADIAVGWAGAVLVDLGFAFPAAQTDNAAPDFPARAEFATEETIRFLGEADVIVWQDSTRDDLAVVDGFPAGDVAVNPLLLELPAAQAGNVYTVGNGIWFLRSLRGRLVLLDQLENDLLPRIRR